MRSTTRSGLGVLKYFSIFIDGGSRYVWVATLNQKSDIVRDIRVFVNRFRSLNSRSIKKIQTDNGGEFVNNVLAKDGINHSLTSPYYSHSNGIVERMNRTIINRVRCMPSHANLSNKFWREAFLTAVDIQNVILTKSLGNKTPFEFLDGSTHKVPSYVVFDCEALVKLPDQKDKKLDFNTKSIILMCSVGNSVYRMFDPNTRRIEYIGDARFIE